LSQIINELLEWLKKIEEIIKEKEPTLLEVCLDCRKITILLINDKYEISEPYENHLNHTTLLYYPDGDEISAAIDVLNYLKEKMETNAPNQAYR